MDESKERKEVSKKQRIEFGERAEFGEMEKRGLRVFKVKDSQESQPKVNWKPPTDKTTPANRKK